MVETIAAINARTPGEPERREKGTVARAPGGGRADASGAGDVQVEETRSSRRSSRPATGNADPLAPGSQAAGRTGRAGFALSLKGRALRYLAAREHSRAELECKLAAHEEEPGQLARVLDDLQAKDFISDSRVVESVINRRAGKLGAARVRQSYS